MVRTEKKQFSARSKVPEVSLMEQISVAYSEKNFVTLLYTSSMTNNNNNNISSDHKTIKPTRVKVNWQ